MESELVGLIGLVVLFILMFAGVPVAAALGLVGLGGFIVLGGWQGALGLFASTPFAQLAHFTLAVVPLFLLLGEFALQGGISEDAYNTAHKWLGKLPAGLGLTTIAANALFAAASGSSVAAAAIFSKIGFPPMVDNKYDKKLAVGTVAAGGTLAALIPPSAVMVMFAIFTEQSVGTLLIAGIVPGAITAVLYIIMLVIRVHVNPTLAPQSTISIPWRDRISSLGNIWGIVIVIAVMFGGIYSGMMTPTEAGGAGALCTFILVIARRRFNTRWLMNSFAECTRTCAMVLILLVTAVIFGRFMAVSGVSGMFADFIIGLGLTPTWIIVMFLVLYVFLGMFLEAIGIMALSLPIIFPVVESLGFNGILFGILTVKMIEVGMLTPPMGLNVYTVKGTLGDKVELTDVFLGCLPFLLCDAILIVILLAFPQVALWLPGSMGK